MKLFCICIISSLLFTPLATAENYPMPALSKQKVTAKFATAKQGFQQRWKKFAKNKTFTPYQSDFNDQKILADFDTLRKTRNAIYYANPDQQPLFAKPDFDRAQDLLTHGFYKELHVTAFEYNSSDSSYNSSNVIYNGYKFLAMEGPQLPQHTQNFLRLLVNYDVKHLVRLTNDLENGTFKTENYWKNAVTEDTQGHSLLAFKIDREATAIPYVVQYYAIDHWVDNSGGDPETLLNLVQKVRQEHKPGEIIAVHCSAGVGRTGTFIAAFLLLDEIEAQLKSGVKKGKLKFSIEELVYKLSLQRPYAVGQPPQYLALHHLAKLYLNRLES